MYSIARSKGVAAQEANYYFREGVKLAKHAKLEAVRANVSARNAISAAVGRAGCKGLRYRKVTRKRKHRDAMLLPLIQQHIASELLQDEDDMEVEPAAAQQNAGAAGGGNE